MVDYSAIIDEMLDRFRMDPKIYANESEFVVALGCKISSVVDGGPLWECKRRRTRFEFRIDHLDESGQQYNENHDIVVLPATAQLDDLEIVNNCSRSDVEHVFGPAGTPKVSRLQLDTVIEAKLSRTGRDLKWYMEPEPHSSKNRIFGDIVRLNRLMNDSRSSEAHFVSLLRMNEERISSCMLPTVTTNNQFTDAEEKLRRLLSMNIQSDNIHLHIAIGVV